MIRKSTFAGAIALASLIAATPALADPITLDSGDVGQSFTVNYDGSVSGQNVTGLSGSATFKLTSVSGTAYAFDYSVTNTTSGGVGSRISSFAFNTDPTISGASSTGAFAYTTLDSSYPNGVGSVDVCFKDAQTGSCAGGGSGGLAKGDTGTGTLTLSFAQPVNSLTLTDFFVRYQSITGVAGGNSGTGTGTVTSTTTTSSGGTPVPEPSMILLFGIGAAGIFIGRRRGYASQAAYQPAYA